MNYAETLRYIHSVSWKGSRPGLERITELVHAIGDPQRKLRFVHVAGTNGKGSFTAMLSSVLAEAGYSVGMFTSPYIEEFTERIQVNGVNIPQRELAEVTSFIRPFADAMADVPTEFELITAIGLEYFRRKAVDVVVLECGMGGRLDSTNVIDSPLASIITGISLDHTDYLGSTIEAIAAEKAGIIKKGRPVLFGGESDAAAAVIEKAAKALDARFVRTDRSAVQILRCDEGGSVFNYGAYGGVRLSLLGIFQPSNAANVIEAVELLRGCGLEIGDAALIAGLEKASWRGRFEKLSEKPLVFFDGGHNLEGAAAAMATVRRFFGEAKLNILTGVMADKHYAEMARVIAPSAARVFTAAPDNPRALDAEAFAAVFRDLGVPAESFSSYSSAVAAAVDASIADGVPLLALGSLYAYAPFKAALHEKLK